MKDPGKNEARAALKRLMEFRRQQQRAEQLGSQPRPRGIFKFRTWEDHERWRQSHTNPGLR